MDLISAKYEEAVMGFKESWLCEFSLDWYHHILSLPEELKVVYCVVITDNQVFNGGLDQYFSNGYGQFAHYTIDALRIIGAGQKANILQEALRLVNQENYNYEDFALRLIKGEIDILYSEDEKLSEILDSLDDEYENLDNEDIQQLLENYLKES